MISQEKTRQWASFVEDLQTDSDMAKVWQTIRRLDGETAERVATNEALVVEDKELYSAKSKAEAFCKFYAKVSRRTPKKRNRVLRCQVREKLQSPTCGESCEEEFSMTELEAALTSMRRSAASGPDDITPPLLQELGPKAKNVLLHLFNKSWKDGECPQAWRSATIIPLLKRGKPALDLKSFRSISLTSCVGKVMERMITNSLQCLAENRGWLCDEQAGFRPMKL